MTDSNSKTRQSDDGAGSPAPAKATSNRPKKKRHSSRPQTQDSQQSNSEATAPETPPRGPKSRHTKTPVTDAQNKRSQHNKQKQRRGSALKEGTSHEPASAPKDVPRAGDGAFTPAKAMQAYAGPNFHASPAPSSLPIPKMFSKSVPQVNDKAASLKAMLHEELSEDSSFSGDGSPTLRNSTLSGEERKRDVSPLEIFFQADKDEKARQQSSGRASANLNTPPNDRRARSTSPMSGPSIPPPSRLSHANAPPLSQERSFDSAVFSMESDGEVFGSRPSSKATATPPPPMDATAQARAKTEALKQLLRFSPSPAPSPGHGPPSRSSSGAFTPPMYNRTNSAQALHGRVAPESRGHLPRFQPPQQRDPSYKHPLHELNSNASPIEPSSRPPFANIGGSAPASRPASGTDPTAGRTLTKPSFTVQDALKATTAASTQAPAPAPSSTQEMEAQLRKILKLDGLPSTGVQS